MKINELFAFIAGHDDLSDAERRSLYGTTRQLIKIRKQLRIADDVDALFKKYAAVYGALAELDEEQHADNFDKLYNMYYFDEDESDEDYSSEDDDIEDSDDEDTVIEYDDDDESDIEEDDQITMVIDVTQSTEALKEAEERLEAQHVKTRWLLGLATLLSLGNFAMASYSAFKIALGQV